MTPQELKNSILQLAIQGKLVEQRLEEGTGEELYQQIQAEKKRLIKAGTIKKEKPLPEITEDEKPFDIPESWKWVMFGSIVNIVSARRVHQSDWKTEGIPFYRAREIAKLASDGFVDNELYISQVLYAEFSKSGVPHSGDLMVTAVGTLGKAYVVEESDKFYYKDASVICLENYAHIIPQYLKYIMQSEMLMNQIRSNSSGTTVATLTMVRMIEYLLPLPPLAEQKRIVAKIEELLPYIDRYEKAWSKLEDFNKRFPADMQKSILQMAIQGKLVEQHPEEGTGEELYLQIQAKRQKLIKAGVIKKEKSLPEITDDVKPFDIPESWKWVMFGSIVNIVSARRVHQSDWKTEGIPFYRAREIAKLASDGFIDNELYISQVLYDEFSKSGVPHSGDLMVTAVGTLGKTYIVEESDKFYYKDASVICLENYAHISPQYLKYIMQTEMLMNQIRSNSSGTTVATLTMVRMIEYLLPLPPLTEQKRIVAKLEKILPLCEKLKYGTHIPLYP